MPGGFTGAGAKTVIPAKAVAKVSMRLVPDQSPAEAFAQYKAFVESLAPRGVDRRSPPHPLRRPRRRLHRQPLRPGRHRGHARGLRNRDTVFIRSGGSIPIVGDFIRELGIPTLLMGFGLPDDNLHAPNEKFHLPNFHAGIQSILRFFANISPR